MLIGAMRIALSPFNMRKRAVGEGVEPRSGCIAVGVVHGAAAWMNSMSHSWQHIYDDVKSPTCPAVG